MSEKHTLEYEDFNVGVEVADDGNVNIDFNDFGTSPLSLSSDVFAEVVQFAEKHGEITLGGGRNE